MNTSNKSSAQFGDLVQTQEGYYGIVAGENEVLLGNGLSQRMIPEEFCTLRILPLNIFQDGGSSNFAELIERPVDAATAERRRKFSRDICGNE